METRETLTVSVVTLMTTEDPRRNLIIRAATERFLEDGFSSVSVADIASRVGMSKKTLYVFFAGGKEELLRAVMDAMLEGIRTELQAIVAGEGDFIATLDNLMAFLPRRLALLNKPMMRDLQRHAPQIWQHIEKFRRERLSNEFRSLICRGREEGYVRGDVDIDIFLNTFIGAVEAVVNPAFLADVPCSAAEVLRSIKTIFFMGILTESAASAFARLQSGSPRSATTGSHS
ncbi:MAG TPA: TetR/AcrR family transcriptional regulator [Bacteroidota bacterium]|nr:TetR/AcrR family transcriptional regulator [Bacteroidota bacterium]